MQLKLYVTGPAKINHLVSVGRYGVFNNPDIFCQIIMIFDIISIFDYSEMYVVSTVNDYNLVDVSGNIPTF